MKFRKLIRVANTAVLATLAQFIFMYEASAQAAAAGGAVRDNPNVDVWSNFLGGIIQIAFAVAFVVFVVRLFSKNKK